MKRGRQQLVKHRGELLMFEVIIFTGLPSLLTSQCAVIFPPVGCHCVDCVNVCFSVPFVTYFSFRFQPLC